MNNYIKSSRIKGLIGIIVYFFCQYFLATGIAIVYVALNKFENEDALFDAMLGVTIYIMGIILFIVLITLICINFKELKAQLVLNFKNYWTYIYPLILFVVYFAALIGLTELTQKFTPGLEEADNQAALIEMFKNVNKIAYMTVTIILAPIVEELVFRYSLVNLFNIEKKFLKWIPYLLSAIVFTLIHESAILFEYNIVNLMQFCTYFVPALVLSFGYMATKRNIVSMIFLHMTINTLATIGMFLQTLDI